MEILLILGVVIAAGFVLFSLARGLFYFSQGHKAQVEGTAQENQMMQNKMMMSRVTIEPMKPIWVQTQPFGSPVVPEV